MIAYEIAHESSFAINALVARVAAGEPLEVGSEIEPVDLNYLLTRGSTASLLIRIDGESMQDVPIRSGDWVMVDCAKQPKPNEIVVAKLNGGYTVKRHKLNDERGRNGLYLVPANRNMKAREITVHDDYRILGVVTFIIHPTA